MDAWLSKLNPSPDWFCLCLEGHASLLSCTGCHICGDRIVCTVPMLMHLLGLRG